MTAELPKTALQLRSLVKRDGELEISLATVPVPQPGPGEVVIRIEGTPINPSDIGLLFAAADISSAKVSGSAQQPVVSARIPAAAMPSLAARVDIPMPVGNEGAGTVVAAGSSPAAQALLGKTVAAIGGGMYAQYRSVPAEQCLLLPPGATAADGASSFVNPLTALGMVETMRRENHRALVHTAAASNLGQMLNRICLADGIGLINIVRKPEQVDLLRKAGAMHVCNAAAPTFMADLIEAVAATGATIGFDATGGGKLASQILTAIEVVASRSAKEYSRYGSNVHKQVYIYGGLESGPTELSRSFGMAWSVGGWLLFGFLARIEPATAARLKQRVAAELKTTFASHYAKEVSLADALAADMIAVYAKRATGAKYLINPSR